MRVLGLIPARGGSKGIPGKNLVDLGGRTLLSWTATEALKSSLTRTIISTDDEDIASEAARCGIEVPFIRPAHLATDTALSIDVALHALKFLEESYDAVMLLQPTTPFRNATDIDGAILLLENEDNVDSVISVSDVGSAHPARMKIIHNGWIVDPGYIDAPDGEPRQRLPSVYILNGAIYLSRTSVVRDKTFHGERSRPWIMPAERSVNIDTALDLALARALI